MPVHLLVRQPHTNTYMHNCTLDADTYNHLLEEGWRFVVNEVQPDRFYLKIYRDVGRREMHLLHRYLCVGSVKLGHALEVHHVNSDPLDNRADNLQLLEQTKHRHLHPKRKAGGSC
jgi:hypothetical protein